MGLRIKSKAPFRLRTGGFPDGNSSIGAVNLSWDALSNRVQSASSE